MVGRFVHSLAPVIVRGTVFPALLFNRLVGCLAHTTVLLSSLSEGAYFQLKRGGQLWVVGQDTKLFGQQWLRHWYWLALRDRTRTGSEGEDLYCEQRLHLRGARALKSPGYLGLAALDRKKRPLGDSPWGWRASG